jgi:hypothetical protein
MALSYSLSWVVSSNIEFALGWCELSSHLTTDIAFTTHKTRLVITRWEPPVIVVAFSSLYILQVLLGFACLNTFYYAVFVAPFLFQRRGIEGIL